MVSLGSYSGLFGRRLHAHRLVILIIVCDPVRDLDVILPVSIYRLNSTTLYQSHYHDV